MFTSNFQSKDLFIISGPMPVFAVATLLLILISHTFDVKVSLKDIGTVLSVAMLKTFSTSRAVLDFKLSPCSECCILSSG
jgi:hypothetical protein